MRHGTGAIDRLRSAAPRHRRTFRDLRIIFYFWTYIFALTTFDFVNTGYTKRTKKWTKPKRPNIHPPVRLLNISRLTIRFFAMTEHKKRAACVRFLAHR